MSGFQAALAVVVTAVWFMAWVLALVNNDFNGIGQVTPIMLAVVTGIFGKAAVDGFLNKHKGDDDER